MPRYAFGSNNGGLSHRQAIYSHSVAVMPDPARVRSRRIYGELDGESNNEPNDTSPFYIGAEQQSIGCAQRGANDTSPFYGAEQYKKQ